MKELEIENEDVVESPHERDISTKGRNLAKELKEYGISSKQWKQFLNKNNLRKVSISQQIEKYLPLFAQDLQKIKKETIGEKIVVSTKTDPLKKLRDELLLELGISTGRFKRLIPKVINKKNGDWDIATREDLAKRLGAKMSMRQQVVWLKELLDATKEIRESVKEGPKQEDMEKVDADPTLIPSVFLDKKETKPTFATE